MTRVWRNDPCPCGSGKKYKQCCGSLEKEPAGLVRAAPTLPPNSFQVALAHHEAGRLVQAEALYRQILQIEPEHPEALHFLGVIAYQTGNHGFAIELIGKAIELRATSQMYSNLGAVFQAQHRLDSAAESYRKAIMLKPDFADAYHNLGIALLDQGKLVEAAENFRKALALKPDYAEAYSKLLFLYGYYALLEGAEYLAQARNWERSCVPAQDRQAARYRVFQRKPLAGRRLRIGYMSGDFRQHAVSYFIKQLFTHHDKAHIELFAYSVNTQRDAITERLQALAEHWVSVVGMTDIKVRDRIESDGIDVLVDLSGHTGHNRLGVFAHRAAPVQAHYLGYFASTGLTEMDYWIGDETLAPADADNHFSEQVWRLPRVWVSYDGKADAPVQNWQPTQDGVLWLGSFNNLGKLTLATLALWAKVLHALPESKLLLKTKGLVDGKNRQRILDSLSGHGILPERIELQDSSATADWSAHMAYYDRLDIALDPIGAVCGGTTTCDALWMGVPVITLEGSRMASRMTVSMLGAIGQLDWVARSEAEYIDKVVSLARDVDKRKALRNSQRARMAGSPLCDAHGLALNLEKAYFAMFERWEANQNGQRETLEKRE